MIYAPLAFSLSFATPYGTVPYAAKAVDAEVVPSAGASDMPPIETITVGSNEYKLMRAVRPVCTWVMPHWNCRANEVSSKLVGVGGTPAEALEQWEKEVHAAFQRLYAKRYFEMDESERQDWSRLLQVIDVNEYRERAPMVMRAVGRIRFKFMGNIAGRRPRPDRIYWVDGRVDRVPDWDLLPADFSALPSGGYIDAVVERHPKTAALQRILDARPIELSNVSQREADKFIESLPEAKLPEVEWTWPTTMENR